MEFCRKRILEWVAIPFSRESSWPRDRTPVSCNVGRFFTIWATREAQTNPSLVSNTQGKPCPWDNPALVFLKVLSKKAQGSQENSLLSMHTHLAEQVSENSPYPLFGIFHFSGSAGAPKSFPSHLPHLPLKCPSPLHKSALSSGFPEVHAWTSSPRVREASPAQVLKKHHVSF